MLTVKLEKSDGGAFIPLLEIENKPYSIKELAILTALFFGSPAYKQIHLTILNKLNKEQQDKYNQFLTAVNIISSTLQDKRESMSKMESAKQPIVPTVFIPEIS